MERLSAEQRKYLQECANRYTNSLQGSPAEDYLATRGLAQVNPEVQKRIDLFHLGYVGAPSPGDEPYTGMLAIPYRRWTPKLGWFTVGIRFRRLDDGKPKYLNAPGTRPWLYNTTDLLADSPVVCITEGELDAITVSACGHRVVGVPGAQMWRPYMSELFRGHDKVVILADGDEPGSEFGRTVQSNIPGSQLIQMPPGHDVNSVVLAHGPGYITERVNK